MKVVLTSIHTIFQWFMDACFPARCLKCGQEGNYLCKNHHLFLPVSKKVSLLKNIPNVVAAVAYDKTAEKIIDYFKFRGVAGISNIMAEEIMKTTGKNFFKGAVLIPVPLHWTRQFWRGFNQAEILAQSISSKVPNLSICKKLKRQKRTPQQSKLKKNERQANVKNVFFWDKEKLPPAKIILVDDVAATGSTLDAAAEVLKMAGAKEISAVVFARGKIVNCLL